MPSPSAQTFHGRGNSHSSGSLVPFGSACGFGLRFSVAASLMARSSARGPAIGVVLWDAAKRAVATISSGVSPRASQMVRHSLVSSTAQPSPPVASASAR